MLRLHAKALAGAALVVCLVGLPGLSGGCARIPDAPTADGPGNPVANSEFEVLVDSVKLAPLGADINYTVKYLASEPVSICRMPSIQDNPSLVTSRDDIGFNGVTDCDDMIEPGSVFHETTLYRGNLHLKRHRFYVIGVNETVDKHELIGTITLRPEDITD